MKLWFWLAPALILMALMVAILGWWLGSRYFQPDSPLEMRIVAEAPGMSPEEVASLIASPIEMQVNGIPGLKRVRTASRSGTCIVWVTFETKANTFEARQRLAEGLQRVHLPANVTPMLAPMSYSEREVLLIGLRSSVNPTTAEERTKNGMDLRTLAEHVVRRRFLALPGVTQVVVTGGIRKQVQVALDPERLLKFGMTLSQVEEALEKNHTVDAAGNLLHGKQELPVYFLASSLSLQDFEEVVVVVRDGVPVRIKDIASVRFGGADHLGDAAICLNEGAAQDVPAVILTVTKEPKTHLGEIDRLLAELQQDLPPGIKLDRQAFTNEDLRISLQLPPAASPEEQDQVCRLVEAELMEVPEIRNVWRRGGLEGAADLGWSDATILFVALERNAQRERALLLADVRERIARLPGVSAQLGPPVSPQQDSDGMSTPIAVKVFGPDGQVLQQAAQEIYDNISNVAGVVDLQIEPQGATEQVQIRVKREEAARLGVDVVDLTKVLHTARHGRVVGEVHEGDRRLELVVMFAEKLGRDPMEIGKLLVESSTGEAIPVDRLAETLVTAAPAIVYRENWQRCMVVTGNVQGRDPTAVLKDIREAMKSTQEGISKLPGAYHVEYAGRALSRGF